jgi:hypothetical protein
MGIWQLWNDVEREQGFRHRKGKSITRLPKEGNASKVLSQILKELMCRGRKILHSSGIRDLITVGVGGKLRTDEVLGIGSFALSYLSFLCSFVDFPSRK